MRASTNAIDTVLDASTEKANGSDAFCLVMHVRVANKDRVVIR